MKKLNNEKKNQSSEFSPIYKLNFKISNFYSSNNTAKEQKTRYRLSKTFAIHISDKGLLSRIYKNNQNTMMTQTKKGKIFKPITSRVDTNSQNTQIKRC